MADPFKTPSLKRLTFPQCEQRQSSIAPRSGILRRSMISSSE
nr:MAG TPA: hypothetical protein [Caudoviricetes sp.]